MTLQADVSPASSFALSRDVLESLVAFLESADAAALGHGELEDAVEERGRALLRQLYQDHLDLRAERERRLPEVVDAQGVPRGGAEPSHKRPLATVFGPVEVRRIAYRSRGQENLYPADGLLNLPTEKHSHGIRRLCAIESARGSFDSAVEAIGRASGQKLGKRQVEELAQAAAADFDTFYASRKPLAGDPGDVVVVSCDGKGVVMRHDALRSTTAEAAAKGSSKLATRLSKGEKRNRKRMAEVGAVYDAAPAPRSPSDILPATDEQRRSAAPGPVTKSKWLVASVVRPAASVVSEVFDEAERRDPDHARTWVALVDGNNHQLRRIAAEANARQVTVSVLVDFIHVLEYLWKAAWSFHQEGDPTAEEWVRKHASAVLAGKATKVAGAIRRAATKAGLEPAKRAGADSCAAYLSNKAPFLDYPQALNRGWPIATGVIEGACRHLVKDRLDLTGARWGLEGAEAVLKLRALRSNGDFASYWRFHIAQERLRVHESRYANNLIPRAE
jgi:hypothetical protein